MPKFKLKAKIDKLEDAPEAYRDAYAQKEGEKDGPFYLNPEKLEAIEFDDKAELAGALDKERKAKTEAERLLRAEQEKLKGVDLEEYNRLKTEAESKETDELKSKGKIDELLEKQRLTLEKKHAEEKKALEAQIGSLTNELSTFKVDLRLRKAFEEAGVMSDRMDDAVALTKPLVKLGENDALKIHDKDGTPLDVSPEGYAKEVLKESKPWLYAPTGAAGSGAPGNLNGGHSKTTKREDFNKLSPLQQSAFLSDVRAGKAQLVD